MRPAGLLRRAACLPTLPCAAKDMLLRTDGNASYAPILDRSQAIHIGPVGGASTPCPRPNESIGGAAAFDGSPIGLFICLREMVVVRARSRREDTGRPY